MGDGVNFSFNKGQKFNITKFDGVSKDELLNRQGVSDSQKQLLTSIFKKYDNGDGILTADEYQAMQADLIRLAGDDNLGGRELKKFNKDSLGVDKNAYSMEDLQAVVGMMVDGKDGVITDSEGNILVQSQQENGGTLTSKFSVDDKNALTLLSDSVVDGDTTTVTEYIGGDKNKKSSIVETRGNSVTTTLYEDNGTDIKSKTCVSGAVTEILDPANGDRVTKKTTDKGAGVTETVDYVYTEDGVTETTYTDNPKKPSSIVKKDAQGNIVSTKTYTYDGDKSTELETTGSGDEAVITRTERNEKGKLTSYVNVDAEGNVQDSVHTVEPGQTWYNIVQAKYGVTDHRITMEIVKQLKTQAKEEHGNFRWIPKEITLPGTITLKSGDTVSLKNTGALVQQNAVDAQGRAIGPRITPPTALTAEQIPPAIDPLPAEQQKITIPTFEVNTSNAGKTVKQDDGQYYKYDDAGRVTHVYANEADKKAGNSSVRIAYDAQGNVTTYYQNSYDGQGHWTGAIEYDGMGAFSDRLVNDQFDPNHPEQFGRQTKYNADGSVNYIVANNQYDDQGRRLSYDNFDADGSWLCSRKLDYGNDGTCQTRYYDCDDHGRMTKIESFE